MSTLTGRSLGELGPGDQADLFVRIDDVAVRRGPSGEPFAEIGVSDTSGRGRIKVAADHKAYEPARAVTPRQVVKVRVVVESAGDPLDLRGLGLRPLDPGETVDLTPVFGPLRPEAAALGLGAIAFDVETTPRLTVDELPERERSRFLRWATEEARRETASDLPDDDAIERALAKSLALHPLTTRVVSIAFHAVETGVALALVAGDEGSGDEADLAPPAIATDEAELLRVFWGVARRARTLVGFNSRRFDLPVLLARSALLGVKAAADPLGTRGGEPSHVDLLDALTGRGAAGDRRMSLELAAFAFGIPVKRSGHGEDVALLVADGRFAELAEYNLEDAAATAALYQALAGTFL